MLEYIAEGITNEAVEHIDLSPPNTGSQTVLEDFSIIGVPVYGGRVPEIAIKRLKNIQGKDTLAAVVVVYGHRAYEDALIELRDLAVEIGFKPIAGGAFVVEHSWSNKNAPIGAGRPEPSDIEMAIDFGRKIKEKVATISSPTDAELIEVPGNYPYKEKRARKIQFRPLHWRISVLSVVNVWRFVQREQSLWMKK
jgi:hypothetical protein